LATTNTDFGPSSGALRTDHAWRCLNSWPGRSVGLFAPPASTPRLPACPALAHSEIQLPMSGFQQGSATVLTLLQVHCSFLQKCDIMVYRGLENIENSTEYKNMGNGSAVRE